METRDLRRSCNTEARRHRRGFATEAEFWEAVERRCLEEFLRAWPQQVLDDFHGRMAVLKACAEREKVARRALWDIFTRIDRAADLAKRTQSKPSSTPDELPCTHVLMDAVNELEELREFLKAQLENRARQLGNGGSGLGPGAGPDPSLQLEHWRKVLRRATFKKSPGHRRLVFIALHDCGALGQRGDSRLLAVASLLAGARPLTFKPGETTVPEAIQTELSRMRGVAVRVAPYWAGKSDLDAWPVDWRFRERDERELYLQSA